MAGSPATRITKHLHDTSAFHFAPGIGVVASEEEEVVHAQLALTPDFVISRQMKPLTVEP